MKIAANDPGLAHAASRASLGMACDALFEEVERDRAAILKAAKGKRSARNLLEGYRRTLGSRILWVRSKALNSTTRAAWTIAHVGAANRKVLVVNLISYAAGDVNCTCTAVACITDHALARAYQRTLHDDDIAGAIERFRPLMIRAVDIKLAGPLETGSEVKLIGSGGALLGVVIDGLMVLRTWVDAATAADPAIRNAAGAS